MKGRQVQALLISQIQWLGCFLPIHLSEAIRARTPAPHVERNVWIFCFAFSLCFLMKQVFRSGPTCTKAWEERGVGVGSCSNPWQAPSLDRLSRRLLRRWTQMQVVDLSGNLNELLNLHRKAVRGRLRNCWAMSSYLICTGHSANEWLDCPEDVYRKHSL